MFPLITIYFSHIKSFKVPYDEPRLTHSDLDKELNEIQKLSHYHLHLVHGIFSQKYSTTEIQFYFSIYFTNRNMPTFCINGIASHVNFYFPLERSFKIFRALFNFRFMSSKSLATSSFSAALGPTLGLNLLHSAATTLIMYSTTS